MDAFAMRPVAARAARLDRELGGATGRRQYRSSWSRQQGRRAPAAQAPYAKHSSAAGWATFTTEEFQSHAGQILFTCGTPHKFATGPRRSWCPCPRQCPLCHRVAGQAQPTRETNQQLAPSATRHGSMDSKILQRGGGSEFEGPTTITSRQRDRSSLAGSTHFSFLDEQGSSAAPSLAFSRRQRRIK